MADKPETLYIAKTAAFPGYWGSSKEGPHHAIAHACDEGASREGVFVVYDAYVGCYMSEMGGLVYLTEHGEPEVEGVYDAAGNRLGDNLADAADQVKRYGEFQPEHCALGWDAYRQLRDYKPE